jgi:type IV pilus assembly protein PilM
LDFFTGSNSAEIQLIYLSGGGSKTKGLKEIIEGKMNTLVEFADPFKTIEYNKKTFDTEYIKNVSLFAAVGVGLASRKIGD